MRLNTPRSRPLGGLMPEASRRAAARLRAWLLSDHVQIAEGPQAGGVVGALDAQGRAQYVYAEITGYYLHWLAGLDIDDPRRRARAEAALAWAQRQFAGDAAPATRLYLDAAPDDWRNRARFFFDDAMLVGGLAAATRHGLIAPPTALLQRLYDELARFVEHDQVRAVRRLADDVVLPDRWSTREDRFLVKATTRVLSAAEWLPLPTALAKACERLQRERVMEADDAPVEMLHPTLYYLEGVVAVESVFAQLAHDLLMRIIALTRADGSLPESPESPDVPRTDIIAQALRLGIYVRARGVPGPHEDATLDRLAAQLIARIDDDGAIAFRPDVETPQRNVWCAMFAEQALRWHAAWRADARFLPDPRDLV